MVEPAVPQTQSASLRVEIPPDDPSVPIAYANNVGVTFGPHDMTIHFSWFTPPPLSELPPDNVIEATVRLISKVSIPLSLARPLATLLERQAEAWEGSFKGEIPNPQGLDLSRPTETTEDPEQPAQEARSTE